MGVLRRPEVWLAGGILVLVASIALSEGLPEPKPTLLLEGVTLIDGTGGAPLVDAYVWVEGERIVAVGRMEDLEVADLEVPAGARREDLAGRFLLPGLIDIHAHAMVPRCQPAGSFDLAVSEKMLETLLHFGITTARSPATPTREGVALREAVTSGRVPGPRLFVSAELINGRSLSAEEVRREVRERLEQPVDFIKLYSALAPEAVQAGIEEAHARGVPVIGHLGRTTWREAAEMGIDFITHAASWSAEDLPAASREGYRSAQASRGFMKSRIDWLERLDPEGAEIDATIRALVARGVSIDPTLVAYDSKFTPPESPRYRRNPSRGVVPEMLRDWQTCGTATDDWSPEDFARMQAAWPKMLRLVERFHQAGVLLTAGSDVTNPWVIPGESLHQELELLVSAGIAPDDVIQIATRNGARALGILDEVGTVEPGKRADLLVLGEDPRLDIRNTRSIVGVLQGGRWVAGDRLSRTDATP